MVVKTPASGPAAAKLGVAARAMISALCSSDKTQSLAIGCLSTGRVRNLFAISLTIDFAACRDQTLKCRTPVVSQMPG